MTTLLTVRQLLDIAATRVVLWPVCVPAAPLRCNCGLLGCQGIVNTYASASTVKSASLMRRSPAVDKGLQPVGKAQWTLVTHPPRWDVASGVMLMLLR